MPINVLKTINIETHTNNGLSFSRSRFRNEQGTKNKTFEPKKYCEKEKKKN